MNWLTSARNFTSFALSLRKYIKEYEQPSLEEAKARLKVRLQNREQRFLEMVETCIYGYSRSPYLPLLRAADCEFGDLRNLVGDVGLEPALRRLRDDGVYFSFEEFKGRKVAERNGVALALRSEDFDNPSTVRHFSTSSGGSSGPPTRVWMNLADRENQRAHFVFSRAAHGGMDAPTTAWGTGDLPSFVHSLTAMVAESRDRWFASRSPRGTKDVLKYAVGSRILSFVAASGGLRLPRREWVDPLDPLPIARWAEENLRSNGKCRIFTVTISKGVRLASTALENGIDLHGASIIGSGEPATPGKVQAIRRSGATWIPTYVFAEGGTVGSGCVQPLDGTDVHFYSDRFGLIQSPRNVPGTDLTVDAFNFTTLSATAPKVLMNVEIDDYGILESRKCGCPFDEVGYDQHIREIYSFQKLTGEGVTLVGSDILRILEEVLPSRFGGSPLDYQLVEEEDENNLTRLSLVIDPRIRIDDESLVIATVLDELKATDAPSSMAGSIWAQAGTFRVKRTKPITTTSRDKLMPLHVTRRSDSVR